jgi:hypothetical protein
MAKKQKPEANLPTVSKQTAGGITGAVLGGIVGGPVGAIAGGVAGALVGNSSAKGNEPIKKAVKTVGSASAKAIKTARDRSKSSQLAKPTIEEAKKVASKPDPSKSKAAPAIKKKKAATKPKAIGRGKPAKKKA